MRGLALALCALVGSLALACGAEARLVARGSVKQVQVTGVKAHARVVLLGRAGRKVQSRKADALGGLVFRGVKPGRGYRVKSGSSRSARFTVMSTRSAPPSKKIYRQKIPAKGYGYVTTRDGTKLAMNVYLPGGSGPYPTLVEYSGYGYANPAGAESSIEQIATLLGFAVVDVNMRGTGCSGGAFDYFEPLQSLDGYDVIETVARQPWVLHHKVGMMGVSYGGISQLFVAQTRPPSLAAIAPLSVIDSTQTTLYPGGILNTGFALSWAKDRVHDSKPASATGGQPWALKQIKAGDKTCKANQVLHGDAVDLLAKTYRNKFYVPKVADPLAPITFVHKIKVPTYMACQFEDEQTGGHCPALVSHFTGTRHKWFTFTNGAHIDSLDPATFTRWFDFLSLYVAKRKPELSPALKALAPSVFATSMGVQGVGLPDDPIQAQPDYASALRAFQALKPVRILFDNGAGGSQPGAPVPGFEQSFSRFPLPGTKARSWYLGNRGALTDRNSRPGTELFRWDKRSRPPTNFTGNTGSGKNGLWTATPPYKWVEGSEESYISAPLKSNTVVVGAGAVQLWVKSRPDVDLQVTVSEVRPDGVETYVQSGWLRASRRKLDPRKSTLLAPVPSLRRRDLAPLPHGKFARVVVPLYYEGHAYRAGSRIRITIGAPVGDQPVWSFSSTAPARGDPDVFIRHDAKRVSRLVLPVVSGVNVPTGLPPCPGLRAEPCRTYVPRNVN